MLKIDHISKTFSKGTVNEKKALDDISLTVDTGDFITIIGSNGAGKSTLFNSISGEFFVGKLIFLPITPLAFYFGSDAVISLINLLPQFVIDGIGIAGGLLPALGFAMLAQMIMNRKVVVFFFLGFFTVKLLGVGTTGVAIFAVILAIVLVGIEKSMADMQKVTSTGGDFDEF